MNKWSGYALACSIVFSLLAVKMLFFDAIASWRGHVYSPDIGIDQAVAIIVFSFMALWSWIIFKDWKD